MKLKKLTVDKRIRPLLKALSLPRAQLGVQSDINTRTAYVVFSRLKILQLAFALFCNEVCNEFLLAVTYDAEGSQISVQGRIHM